jgi:hypothetical protein
VTLAQPVPDSFYEEWNFYVINVTQSGFLSTFDKKSEFLSHTFDTKSAFLSHT